MRNLIDEYIEYTQKCVKKYMKIIFESKNNQDIVKEYLVAYINVRYYDVYHGEKKHKVLYQKIADEIDIKCKNLLQANKTDEKENVEQRKEREERKNAILNTRLVFYYLIFWDGTRKIELEDPHSKKSSVLWQTVEEIEKIREEKLKLKKKPQFKDELYNQIRDDLRKKEEILSSAFNTDKFHLKLTRNKKRYNIYYAKLEHNIDFPLVYSEKIIDKVFNDGVIGEDKLKVEFILLSSIILNDIVDGNFRDKFIVKLTPTLFSKTQKFDGILQLIDNQILQEKIYLGISYTTFIQYRSRIIRYTEMGFKFSIELDSNFKDVNNMEYLKIFDYVLAPEKLKITSALIQYKDKFTNLLEK